MKNRFRILALYLYAVLFAVSCSPPKGNNSLTNSTGITNKIDLTSFIERPVGLKAISSIADRINYVVLKTDPKEPLNRIYEIYSTSEYIFIIDRSRSIFIFNRSGKFIRKISHNGRGPGEYTALNFTFNDDKKVIAIGTVGNVLFYDINDNLLKTLKVKGNMENFKWLDKDLYLVKKITALMEGDTSAISSYVINSNGDLIARHKYFVKEKPPKNISGISGGKLDLCINGILLSEPHNDTVYLVNHTGMRLPFIIYSYGSHKIPREVDEGYPILPIPKDMKYIRMVRNFIWSQYAFVEFYYQGVRIQGIWDFNNGKAMTFPARGMLGGIEDDLDGGPLFKYGLTTNSDFDGNMLDVINPQEFLTDKSVKPRSGSDLEKIKNNLTIYDDPIIRIIHLKAKI